MSKLLFLNTNLSGNGLDHLPLVSMLSQVNMTCNRVYDLFIQLPRHSSFCFVGLHGILHAYYAQKQSRFWVSGALVSIAISIMLHSSSSADGLHPGVLRYFIESLFGSLYDIDIPEILEGCRDDTGAVNCGLPRVF